MVCNNCGTPNPADVRFCSNCGADLQAQSAPVYSAPAQNQSYNAASQPANYYQITPVNNTPEDDPGKGLAIAGMILGIVSFLCFPAVTGTLGIIFGAVAKSKGSTSGMATAGIVCGAIGIGLWLLMLVACGGSYMEYFY